MTKQPTRMLPTPLTKNEGRALIGYTVVPTNAMGTPAGKPHKPNSKAGIENPSVQASPERVG